MSRWPWHLTILGVASFLLLAAGAAYVWVHNPAPPETCPSCGTAVSALVPLSCPCGTENRQVLYVLPTPGMDGRVNWVCSGFGCDRVWTYHRFDCTYSSATPLQKRVLAWLR